jgi:hypothetical protein
MLERIGYRPILAAIICVLLLLLLIAMALWHTLAPPNASDITAPPPAPVGPAQSSGMRTVGVITVDLPNPLIATIRSLDGPDGGVTTAVGQLYVPLGRYEVDIRDQYGVLQAKRTPTLRNNTPYHVQMTSSELVARQLCLVGWADYGRGDAAGALQSFNQARSRYSDSVAANMGLGYCALKHHDNADAKHYAWQVLAIDPNYKLAKSMFSGK